MIVVPYTPTLLRTETVEAVMSYDPEAWFVDVAADNFAYADLLGALWAAGDTFTVVEHDMVPAPGQLAALDGCQRPWCSHAYRYGRTRDHIGPALGCTKFHAGLLARHPYALTEAARVDYDGYPAGHWVRMDIRLRLTLERLGIDQHVHDGLVAHLHDYWP